MARKIINIAADNHRMFAVCDDGTLWMQGAVGSWSPVEGPADAETPAIEVVEGADVASAPPPSHEPPPPLPEHHNKKVGASHGR